MKSPYFKKVPFQIHCTAAHCRPLPSSARPRTPTLSQPPPHARHRMAFPAISRAVLSRAVLSRVFLSRDGLSPDGLSRDGLSRPVLPYPTLLCEKKGYRLGMNQRESITDPFTNQLRYVLSTFEETTTIQLGIMYYKHQIFYPLVQFVEKIKRNNNYVIIN